MPSTDCTSYTRPHFLRIYTTGTAPHRSEQPAQAPTTRPPVEHDSKAISTWGEGPLSGHPRVAVAAFQTMPTQERRVADACSAGRALERRSATCSAAAEK